MKQQPLSTELVTAFLSSELFSQLAIHQQYGGVMPEAASRSHLEKITLITNKLWMPQKLTLNDIDVIAVTTKTRLPGSLLVGLSFAQSISVGT